MKRLKAVAWKLTVEVYSDPASELAEKQALLARRIYEKIRERQPYELKLLFCKKCKSYSPPMLSKRIRIRNGMILYTCGRCGATYRIPFK